MMAQTLKELSELGFSPINSLLIVGLAAFAAYAKKLISDQDVLRENWHADTRKQMEKVEVKVVALERNREEDRKRIDECEDDRQSLNAQVKRMAEDIATFKDCTYVECPFRLKRKIHQL